MRVNEIGNTRNGTQEVRWILRYVLWGGPSSLAWVPEHIRTEGEPDMMDALRRFVKNEDGAAAIEYALIASAIAVVIATAVFTLGGNIRNMFTRLAGLIR